MRARHAVLVLVSALALLGFGGLRSWLTPTPSPLPAGAEAFRIEVRRPREDLVVTRDATGPWVIARHDDLADAEAVGNLLDGLRALEFGPVIAPSEKGLATGLGPADVARVRILDATGRPLFDGLFGRRLFGRTSYFRASDRDDVRLATGADPELLLRSSSQWREPRLLPGGCPGGLEFLSSGIWRMIPAPAGRELCALRASHWATGTPEKLAGLERPFLRVRASDGRGFTVGDRRGAERLVLVDGRTALLRVPAAAVETAAADLIDFAP